METSPTPTPLEYLPASPSRHHLSCPSGKPYDESPWPPSVVASADPLVSPTSSDAFEPKILTELPKEMFKKPQLKRPTTVQAIEDNKLIKPTFSKKKQTFQGKSPLLAAYNFE
ncbi:hypothetical protein QJS10_CPB04g00528 [Acorus calamus]|uniref:Uncharacterized protein n=1 Tax=Acorus calamus TaxID=4465 RepID=A0AAV9EYX9_ACOCL|nr:hypothetical protein QJS10_CPB04g00528 [Acorus calamus]